MSRRRATYRRLASAARLATCGLRPMPDFLIVGAMKSGTTSLHHLLCQHPQIREAREKEIHFYDHRFRNGLRWYRAQFPLRVAGDWLTGEASPYYLFHPLAPARITKTQPDARIIAVLRDPVERAISHYRHWRSRGHETLTLAEALREEDHRLEPEVARINADPNHVSLIHVGHSYRARGLYLEQLQRFEHFRAHKRLLILIAEELYRDPLRSVRRTLEFLGLDPSHAPADVRPRNVGQPVDGIDPGVREQLRAFYRPHNRALADYLGFDPGWPT